MPDTRWIENLSRIARQSAEQEGPCDVIMGTVASASPLQVALDGEQQLPPLSAGNLLVPEHLTDHTVQMDLPELGTASVLVHSGLKAGERVLLVQRRGGQQYAILGRQ